MIRTKATELLAPAGITPAGKLNHANYSGLLWLVCAIAAMGIAPVQAQTSYPKGSGPYAGVIRDPAGNLYGTTGYGGDEGASCNLTFNGCGVVFKLDTAGHERVLYAFTGGTDGGILFTGVIADAAGHLYGTTDSGGVANVGVVFKLDAVGHETVLHSFTGGTDGAYPNGVIHDAAGNLYGTAGGGGTSGQGVVFRLDPAGHETVLYSFSGGADGDAPLAVIPDSAGNLYGATAAGGAAGCGGFGCGVVRAGYGRS